MSCIDTIILALISLISVFSGFVGFYIKYLLDQQNETKLLNRRITEDKYRIILVHMLCAVEPMAASYFSMDDPNIKTFTNRNKLQNYFIKKVISYYYIAMLYANDSVLKEMKKFIDLIEKQKKLKPLYHSLIETALAMRKDLWKKGIKIKVEDLIVLSDLTSQNH